jgi:hypothetical protein
VWPGPAQPPQQTDCTDHLDRRVSTKANHSDAASDKPGTDRHQSLDHVPTHGEVLKPQGTAVQSDAAFRRESDHDDLGYGHRALAPGPNLREGPMCKGDTVTRPSADGAADSVTTVPTLPSSLPAAFGAGAGVGVLGGLIGLGGAEFRLPLLIGVFGFLALQAVIMNKAMSLIVVLTALPARLAAVPIDTLTDYWFVVVNLLAGSLSGQLVLACFPDRGRRVPDNRVKFVR